MTQNDKQIAISICGKELEVVEEQTGLKPQHWGYKMGHSRMFFFEEA